jgi:hypothetical protein
MLSPVHVTIVAMEMQQFIPAYCCCHGHSWQQYKMVQVCHENSLLRSHKILYTLVNNNKD